MNKIKAALMKLGPLGKIGLVLAMVVLIAGLGVGIAYALIAHNITGDFNVVPMEEHIGVYADAACTQPIPNGATIQYGNVSQAGQSEIVTIYVQNESDGPLDIWIEADPVAGLYELWVSTPIIETEVAPNEVVYWNTRMTVSIIAPEGPAAMDFSIRAVKSGVIT